MTNALHRRWKIVVAAAVAVALVGPAVGQLASQEPASVGAIGDSQVASPCPVCDNHNEVLL